MLKRYTSDGSGKKQLLAKIYTRKDHSILLSSIDKDAVRIIRRLKREGYEGYIVGGAVRDLLKGIQPKDFDIATNALPKKIRHLFWNSRIIGKRFKLVHIHFKDKIFEVSTFRSADSTNVNNTFGAIEEDVKRRDFSMNALYYNPINQQIIDFVDGMKDIREKRIRSLIPLDTTFKEDPVRIIRGIKYSATTGFRIERKLKRSMAAHAELLADCPSSRMTEELFKILDSGSAKRIFKLFIEMKALKYILPFFSNEISSKKIKIHDFLNAVGKIDDQLPLNTSVDRGKSLHHILLPFITYDHHDDVDLLFYDIFMKCKKILSPLTPPNVDIEEATRHIMTVLGIQIPHNRRLSIKKSKRKALQKSAGPTHKRNNLVRHRKYRR